MINSGNQDCGKRRCGMKIRKILVTIGMLTMVVFAIIGIIGGVFFNTSLSLVSLIIILTVSVVAASMLELPQCIFYCISSRFKRTISYNEEKKEK